MIYDINWVFGLHVQWIYGKYKELKSDSSSYCDKLKYCYDMNIIVGGGRVTMFNVTFNNISVISWWSVLLMEGTRVIGENHQLTASH